MSLDAARYQRLRRLVFEAAELPAARRDELLRRECGTDETLYAEARALLHDDVVPTADVGPTPGDTHPSRGSRRRAPLERVGPYRLGAELGRGGMGVVHEAVDERTGERVAVKVLHDHVLSERMLARFEREAKLGASIAHGGVVRTLDAGREDAGGAFAHYLVMERVHGRTLRRLLEDLGAVPEALVREIARQAAAALSAIHAAGVVHRDLKPDNVLISDDQRVRIMDLGIAKVEAASAAITREGQFLGSLSHAAPEQLAGREVGPAADLYALGVTLYEIATGTNPFARETAAATITAHLEHVPPRAGEVAEISSFLCEVLATLLEKDPAKRFGSAAELQSVLAAAEDGPWWQARRAARAASQRLGERATVGRATAVHGRDAEVAALREAWRRAAAGRGGSVLLEGEAGSGKSRLLADLAVAAEAEGALVVHVTCVEGQGLRHLAQGLEVALGPGWADEAARHLAATPPLLATLRALVEGRPLAQEGASNLPHAAARLLEGLASDRQVYWAFDDLESAPRETRIVAAALGRAAATRRALVVASCGPRLEAAERERWLQAPGSRRVVLGRLTLDAVQALIAEALGSDDLAPRLAPRLVECADGMPAHVFELLGALRARGALRRDARGAWRLDDLPGAQDVPTPLREVVSTRLAALPPDERAVLDAACVQGARFDAALVAAMLARPLVHVLQHLAELERRHGLVRSEGRRHAFESRLAAELLRHELPEALAAEHHASLAEELLRRSPPGRALEGRAAVDVVEHALRGSRPEVAVPHVAAAIDHLHGRNLCESVLEISALALERGDLAPATRALVLIRRAFALGVLGRRDEERAACAAALAAAEDVDDLVLRSRAQGALGVLAWNSSEPEEAARRFEEARRLAAEAGDRQLELGSARNVAVSLGRTNQWEKALELHAWCAERALELNDTLTRAMSLANSAAILVSRGEHGEAMRRYEEAIVLGRECGDVRIEAHAEGGAGLAAYHLGRFDAALEHDLKQVRLARDQGDRRSEGVGHGNAALASIERGRLADALRHFARAREIAVAIEDRRSLAITTGNLGHALLHLGDTAGAREREREALELARALRHEVLEAYTLVRLALAEEVDERPEEAARLALEAVAAFERIELDEMLAQALGLAARTSLASGRGEQAAALLDRALEHAARAENPSGLVIALLQRAADHGGDAAEALAELARHEATMGVPDRLRARWSAWRATRDRSHLAEADRLLQHLRQHAPRAQRDALVARVPLHRAVSEAWSRERSR